MSSIHYSQMFEDNYQSRSHHDSFRDDDPAFAYGEQPRMSLANNRSFCGDEVCSQNGDDSMDLGDDARAFSLENRFTMRMQADRER